MELTATLNVQKILEGVRAYGKATAKAHEIALDRVAIQFLTFCNHGSPAESRRPPIAWGVLRGSASVFNGSKLVGVANEPIKSGAKETPTPATSYAGKPNTITIVYNASYAMRMHEWRGKWGEATKRDPQAGNKWIERHVKADGPLLMRLYAQELKREAGA